jgi:hypothetical protein
MSSGILHHDDGLIGESAFKEHNASISVVKMSKWRGHEKMKSLGLFETSGSW